MSEFYTLICPHCEGCVIVYSCELNCRIFRHGTFIRTGKPIPPHSSKIDCDRWASLRRIYGCGKPFQVVRSSDGNEKAVTCDYI